MSRRQRKTDATREAILAAAREVLASDGAEALSLSKVAHLAGVNRGTAYQHFRTREELIKATVNWVSEHLCTKFSNIDVDSQGRDRPMYDVVTGLVDFAVENPALGRIWLFEVLAADNPGEDPFFRRFKISTQQLADSEQSQAGIDAEVLSVIMLAGYFLWAEWTRAQAKTATERKAMARRMRHEVLRLFLHGVLKPEVFPQLRELLQEELSLDKAE